MALLEVSHVHVEVEGKEIIHDANLSIEKGEIYAMFGPNGSGKTTLFNAIVGLPGYKVTKGRIVFNGKDITKLEVNERVKLGIGLSFQHPPELKGVTLLDMINICLGNRSNTELDKSTLDLVRRFSLEEFLERNINLNFSGGEKKRADILQILLMKPKFLLLDEPDSGVDPVNLKFIGKELESYIYRTDASVLVITHQGEVLKYLNAKHACIMVNGRNSCYKSPQRILEDIKAHGYERCITCRAR
ncbi:MAG: ABC transporter ATP-binding protein [Candidatus Woesearchaeota archaeon]